MAAAAGLIKFICGVANNAAWLVALEALDHARRCRGYRGNVKYRFNQSVAAYHDYERNLIHNKNNRMFCVADMTPDIRKKYGNITDREYYDFWTATGAQAYTKTKPMITSLWNKYRLSLQSHGVKESEHLAWVMTATAALELAVNLYKRAIKDIVESYKLPRHLVEYVFSQFSLEPVRKRWNDAMLSLSPHVDYTISGMEERNIVHGLEQLQEAWTDTSVLYDSASETVAEYEEVFRTPGEQKKVMSEIANIKADTEANL
jgi:hypothetical protein